MIKKLGIFASFFIFLAGFFLSPNFASAAPLSASVPANYAKIVKTVSTPAQPGGTVDFTVTITLGSARSGVIIEDIFSGGGRAPDTDFVPGSAVLDGVPIADPVLVHNYLNWIQYDFKLGDLGPGTYTLTYKWKINPKSDCHSSPANEVHLDAANINGHISTSTVRFPIRCVLTPSFPSCVNINAPVKVFYPSGLHWIVGNPVLQEGLDKVFNLGSNNYVQCFCPTTGKYGIQTNWLTTGALTQTQINSLISQGWIFVTDGSVFDLSAESYIAKNSSYWCPKPQI